jgi:mannosyltransferase
MIVPGENGIIVPPGDGEALAAAIATYLADPTLAIAQGETALAHVRENFALEKEATAINRIYQQLLGA